MSELSLAPICRIGHAAGAERISDEAKLLVRELATSFIEDIFSNAAKIADNAGRKTVMKKDVILAFKLE